jgi:D-sedoheptulose 7-phosphate isomerase
MLNGEPQSELTQKQAADALNKSIDDAIRVLDSARGLMYQLQQATKCCISALKNGHKLLVCGNGGSACEAQHLVGELVGRYVENRVPLPAIALNSDSAVMTCIANDFGYKNAFARQVRALGGPGDVLIVFSTSGQAPNVVEALRTARELRIFSVAFLGHSGGSAAPLADCALIVSHSSTARIQEAHQFLMHSMMDMIEPEFADVLK